MSYPYKQFYRRKLPHLQPPNATLFVTFRLAGSVPKSVLAEWKSEKVWIEKEVERGNKIADKDEVELYRKQKDRLMDFHRRWFVRFEEVLHKEATGPVWLKDTRIANLVAESLQYRDRKVYRLDAYCIMSNHVHVVFAPFLGAESLTEVAASNPLVYESVEATLGVIMQSLKGYIAHEANKILNRTGQFWEAESYDHVVRDDDELSRIIRYVLNNPVKARLIKDWRDWKWSWRREAK